MQNGRRLQREKITSSASGGHLTRLLHFPFLVQSFSPLLQLVTIHSWPIAPHECATYLWRLTYWNEKTRKTTIHRHLYPTVRQGHSPYVELPLCASQWQSDLRQRSALQIGSERRMQKTFLDDQAPNAFRTDFDFPSSLLQRRHQLSGVREPVLSQSMCATTNTTSTVVSCSLLSVKRLFSATTRNALVQWFRAKCHPDTVWLIWAWARIPDFTGVQTLTSQVVCATG